MEIITSSESLKNLCKQLEGKEYLAIDTEFMRSKTFFPKLCLIQVATPEKDLYIIDVIENEDMDLSPFLDIMRNDKIRKIFHGGIQDAEVFYYLMNDYMANLFDSQIAAAFLGIEEIISYDRIVKRLLNKDISKELQFTDWEKRPLSSEHLEYAAGDVKYLIEIYKKLTEELKKKNFYQIVLEETDIIFKEVVSRIGSIDHIVKKISANTEGITNKLIAITNYRENKVQQINIPRSFFMTDDVIREISETSIKDIADLLAIFNGKTKNKRNSGKKNRTKYITDEVIEEIFTIIKDCSDPKDNQAEKQVIIENIRKIKKIKEIIKIIIDSLHKETKIFPLVVAGREDIDVLAKEILIAKDSKISLDDFVFSSKIMNGWRYDIFGKVIKSFFAGQNKIICDENSCNVKIIN